MDLAADPALRAAVQAARDWGVPPSVFLGRPLVTTHEYDAAGRLVRSTTEPAWTREDRDAAMALAAYEADLCPGCGHPLAETTLLENEERYRGELVARCHRCTTLERTRERYEKNEHASALLLAVRLVDPAAADSSSG